MTHDELRESLPAYALGALDANERRDVASHVATCAECTKELAELERVVTGIGLDAEPVSPPAGLRARVLERVAAEQRQPAREGTVGPSDRRTLGRFTTSPLALAASVLIAVAASVYALALRSEIATLRQDVAVSAAEASRLRGELTTLRRSWVEVTRVLNVLKAPDMLKVDLKGQANMPDASGRAFWSRTAGLMFTADRLPALPAGRVYQLWAITGTAATGAGTFSPDPQGSASVTTAVAADAPRPDAFGVTIEPTGGSAAPTMPIVLVGSSK